MGRWGFGWMATIEWWRPRGGNALLDLCFVREGDPEIKSSRARHKQVRARSRVGGPATLGSLQL